MSKPKKQKLAYRLAQQIARDILDEGLEAATPLGKEPALLIKYRVSRESFREAVRILEWQGIAKSVRGPGGGLQVGSPASGAISNLLRDYLQLMDTSVEDLIEASRTLNTLTVKILSATLDSEGSIKLLALTAERRKLHGSQKGELKALLNVFQEMGRLTSNPALALFMSPIIEVLTSMALNARTYTKEVFISEGRKSWLYISKCIEAIIAGDDTTAVTYVNYYLDQIEQLMSAQDNQSSSSGKRKRKPKPPTWIKDNDSKMAQSFIYRLHRDIRAKQLQPGDRLGLETELILKYDISRSILREAVCMLEIIGLVEQRKGRDGGLFVSTPDSSGIVSAISIFLGHMNFNYAKLSEARLAIEMRVAQLAAQNIDANNAKWLTEALELEQQASDDTFIFAAGNIQITINKLAKNRVFSLYIDVMLASSIFKIEDRKKTRAALKNAEKIKHSHHLLAQAILDKNPSMASRRIIEHRKMITKLLKL